MSPLSLGSASSSFFSSAIQTSKHKYLVLERFSIECRKTKTKVIAWPITGNTNYPMNQSGLEGNAYITGVHRGKALGTTNMRY